ncbi:hypothetical protein OAZ15_00100 [Pelagibacteraceae bacterium]|nr:hypothetical protein [Pelagibacteraceae bacterium]
MKNHLSQSLSLAEEAYKNKKYLLSYSFYKKIYRKYNLIEIIPRLIDIAFISMKQTNTKLKFISDLIILGHKQNNKPKISNELNYLNLKLLREFKKFSEFDKLYNSIDPKHQRFVFTEFEYLHYLLETENYSEAEIVLKKIQSENHSFYKILDIFFLNKNFFDQVLNSKLEQKHEIMFQEQKIKSEFDYVVVVVGNHEIFEKEMLGFIKSLKQTSSKYLLSLLIHDVEYKNIKSIYKKIEELKIENLSITFESSTPLNLDKSETKAYYTARRFILANDMMEKFSKTIFVFDADYIINKDLLDYLNLNKDIDISICIKNSFRYFHLIISANQTMFNNTENSRIFLNFYKKYIYYVLNYKKIRWHIDQIVLYIAFIMTKRFYNSKIIGNLNKNNYQQKDCYFYHTFHGKYTLIN